jgi:predicted O-methyltransferase YrrM
LSLFSAEHLLPFFILPISVLVAAVVCWRDLHRRRISILRVRRIGFLTLLDIIAISVVAGFAVFYLGFATPFIPMIGSGGVLVPSSAFDALVAILIAIYLWTEGRRQIQFQRPDGIVAGEFLILFGASGLLFPLLFGEIGFVTWRRTLYWAGWIVAGGAIIAVVVPKFLERREEHRIIERVTTQGEAIQAEYTPATAECPHPERWKMVDSMTAEVEVLDFLKSLVMTVKPELVVETGTFMGISAIKMAEGMKENGFGRIITCEFDPVVFQMAKERIQASGLGGWIECRNESSLDMKIDGTIDIFFSDSDIPIREKEIRRFLPQINPNGIVLTHDASSHYKIVREEALRLEEEGLLSVVLVATPRGLVIAQKRKGRK